jgi:ADP-heptose:LPS heptosyltransferase
MRVLAIRPRALGDVVLVTPALRALARSGPDVSLEVVTEPRYRPLLEGLEGVSRVWTLERDAWSTVQLAICLRRRRFDLAVDFFGNPRSALLCRLSGAARSAGYALRGRGRAYDLRVPRTLSLGTGRDGRPGREYAAATHVRLAVAAGGRADGLNARIARPSGMEDAARRLLEQAGVRPGRRAVGLVAAGSWPTKTWPAIHAGLLARSLIESGREVLLLTGPGEAAFAEVVRRHAPAIRELPPCGVGELVAVIATLAAVVGTDSGPKHAAAALGIPTFTWYGPTHPDTWSTPGEAHGRWWTSLPCRGCDRTACPHWNCMPGLSAAHATRLVLDHLDRHERPASDLGPAARA